MTQQINGQDAPNYVREDKSGSDCNGVDEAVDRVLTLANVKLTANERVYVDGTLLDTGRYTVSHLAASSTITFDDPLKIFDSQDISVIYQLDAV